MQQGLFSRQCGEMSANLRQYPTISEEQAELIAYDLADIVREFMQRPGERERYGIWLKERGYLYDDAV